MLSKSPTFLEFEKIVLLEQHNSSSLLIAANGLSIDFIAYNSMRIHCDPHNLVFVCNHSINEANFIKCWLELDSGVYVPRIISSETNHDEREAIYATGGVVFVSSRILVVDLLLNRVRYNIISGIFMLRSHLLQNQYQDAFVVRLLKERNSNLFVRAFSDFPAVMLSVIKSHYFMHTFSIRKLILLPRYRMEVIESLKHSAIIVEEIKVNLSHDMMCCQTALIELIQSSLRELNLQYINSNRGNILFEHIFNELFERSLVKLYDQTWHSSNSDFKYLLYCLSNFRRLLYQLTEIDAFSFLRQLEGMRRFESKSIVKLDKNSGKFPGNYGRWFLLDQFSKLMSCARNRTLKKCSITRDFDMEICPKFKVLQEIILESANSLDNSRDGCFVILILVNRDKTADSIIRFLKYNLENSEDFLSRDKEEKQELHFSVNSNLCPPGCQFAELSAPWLLKNHLESRMKLKVIVRAPPLQCGENLRNIYGSGGLDPEGRLFNVFNSLQPDKIIMLKPRLNWIREVETYAARLSRIHNSNNPKINAIILVFSNSMEEQCYLNALRDEKDAFEALRKISLSQVLVEEDLFQKNLEHLEHASVFIDLREFRSELPAVLYERGLKLCPMTLRVADYILAPHLAIERKSIPDLVVSLNSGHLFQQCTELIRAYLHPILLIELNKNQNMDCDHWLSSSLDSFFSLFVGKHSIRHKLIVSGLLNIHHLLCRIVILTIKFSTMRIMWSISPHATADLFCEMKLGRLEPSIKKNDPDSDEINQDAIDALLRMPGISWQNYFHVTEKVSTLKSLTETNLVLMQTILLCEKSSSALHHFLHYNVLTEALSLRHVDDRNRLPRMHIARKRKIIANHTSQKRN